MSGNTNTHKADRPAITIEQVADAIKRADSWLAELGADVSDAIIAIYEEARAAYLAENSAKLGLALSLARKCERMARTASADLRLTRVRVAYDYVVEANTDHQYDLAIELYGEAVSVLALALQAEAEVDACVGIKDAHAKRRDAAKRAGELSWASVDAVREAMAAITMAQAKAHKLALLARPAPQVTFDNRRREHRPAVAA